MWYAALRVIVPVRSCGLVRMTAQFAFPQFDHRIVGPVDLTLASGATAFVTVEVSLRVCIYCCDGCDVCV